MGTNAPQILNTTTNITLLKSLTFTFSFSVVVALGWEILKEMGIPDHLTCLLGNLYTGQEATVRTEHGTTDWLQIGKRSTSRLYIVTLLI